MINTEIELWRKFRNGDRNAFESLLNLFYGPLFEYGSRFQKDDDKLRDALHNLMISLWERREFLNDTENLRLYLFKAIRHQIFREKQTSHVSLELPAENEHEDLLRTNYAESDIIENELVHEKTTRIKAIMNKLSKRQQEILHLKFYENLTNEQISDLLDISRPAVANLLYQTLKIFRSHWQINAILLITSIFISMKYADY